MKKEQEASQQQQQQQKSDAAQVGNHIGSSNPPSFVTENHVPHQSQAMSGSKSLLAKIGLLGSSEQETTANKSSVIESAVALAGVDSAIASGSQAAIVLRSLQKGGDASTVVASEQIIEERAPPGPTKLPPSMTSPSTTTTTAKKKDSGGGRRGGGGVDTPRFSQLLDPAVIDDHFDQYLAGCPPRSSTAASARRPTATGDEFPAFSYDKRPTTTNEPSSARDSRSRAIQRRKTLPGRPPGPLLVGSGDQGTNPGHRAPAPTLTGKRDNEAISYVAAAAAATATAASAVPVYRKPSAAAVPPPPPRTSGIGGAGARLRKATGSNRGSMPDVSECASVSATGASPPMPREEVHVLSQLRREELRRLREEAARRHQQDVVLRLGDIKEWCQERQLLVLVIALNISLATVFFNLLTH